MTAKTYLRDARLRPAWVRANSRWWTHDRLRPAYRLLERLTRQQVLFTYLREDLDGLGICSATNWLEGGCNHPIKDLLRRHRGMTTDHRRRAAEWWCYLHSPKPTPPAAFIQPEHYKPAPTATIITNDPAPRGYSTTATAEEGLWACKGWAGRPNRPQHARDGHTFWPLTTTFVATKSRMTRTCTMALN